MRDGDARGTGLRLSRYTRTVLNMPGHEPVCPRAGHKLKLNADKTVTHNGLCLTAGAGGGANGTAVANIWGKTLSDGGLALVFINADKVLSANLTCDAACLGIAGWEPAQKLAVRDLWAKADAAPTTAAVGISVANLEPSGGVAMFKLTPVW